MRSACSVSEFRAMRCRLTSRAPAARRASAFPQCRATLPQAQRDSAACSASRFACAHVHTGVLHKHGQGWHTSMIACTFAPMHACHSQAMKVRYSRIAGKVRARKTRLPSGVGCVASNCEASGSLMAAGCSLACIAANIAAFSACMTTYAAAVDHHGRARDQGAGRARRLTAQALGETPVRWRQKAAAAQ